jgi:hypothetical protein
MTRQERSRDWSVALIGAAGLAVVLYGIAFLVVNFTAFIELGLTPDLVGTSAALRVENPTLYNYLSHLQVNLAAFIIAYGIVLVALAWFPIRRGQRWAVWTVLGSALIAGAIGLPIHYVYGLATLGHLGPFYVVTVFVLVGSWLGFRSTEA